MMFSFLHSVIDTEYMENGVLRDNKKFELMLTRRAKAYSSSGSH